MVTQRALDVARQTAEELRERGADEQAAAIETLLAVAREDAVPTLDLLTSNQAGELFGVTGQTIKNWVKQGQLEGYRVGGRIMVPKDALIKYVQRARTSLELPDLSDEEAASLVAEGRRRS